MSAIYSYYEFNLLIMCLPVVFVYKLSLSGETRGLVFNPQNFKIPAKKKKGNFVWKRPAYILKLYNEGGSWFYLLLRQDYSTPSNPLQLSPIESEKKSEHSSKWIKNELASQTKISDKALRINHCCNHKCKSEPLWNKKEVRQTQILILFMKEEQSTGSLQRRERKLELGWSGKHTIHEMVSG